MILKVSDIEKASSVVKAAGMELVDPEAAYAL